MPVVELTPKFINSAPPGEYTDSEVSGLKLRITDSGQGAWSIRYTPLGSTSKRRFPLGEYPAVTITEARKKAESIRGKKIDGQDPAAEREAVREERQRLEEEETLTVEKAVELYTPALKGRKDSWDQDLGHLRRDIQKPFGSRALSSITKTEIAKRLHERAAKAKVSANRSRSAMLTFFAWCVEASLLETSPMEGIKKPTKKERKEKGIGRALSDAELVVLLKAIAASKLSPGIKAAFRVLALTGQRPGEIAGLELAELHHLDGEAYAHIPAARMKARREHVWPISKPVLAVLKGEIARLEDEARVLRKNSLGDYVFGSRFYDKGRISRHSLSQALRRLIPTLSIDGEDGEIVRQLQANAVTPHAFRRTCITGMAKLRVPKEYRKAIVAHVDDDVEAEHYNAYDFFAEKQLGLNKWAAHVEALLSGEKATGVTVVPLRGQS